MELTRSQNMVVTCRRPAKGASGGSVLPSAAPHSPQNLADDRTMSPQVGQITKGAPRYVVERRTFHRENLADDVQVCKNGLEI